MIILVLGVYNVHSYGLLRDWKKDIIFFGLSDAGGVPMFIIPEHFRLEADINLVSSGVTGIITIASEISGKALQKIVLSGEVPIFISKKKNTIAWIFVRSVYPKLLKELSNIHDEIESRFGEELSEWSGFVTETSGVRNWLAEILGLQSKSIKKREDIDRVIEEFNKDFE